MTALVPVTGLLWCQVFGEFRVSLDGVPADLGGPKQRLVLAVLLCRAGTVVRVDELITALWGHQPPRTARKSIQVYVSKLRRIFGRRLGYVNYGYRLSVDPEVLDLCRFQRLARNGRALARRGDVAAAADQLAEAVTLWGDGPFTEFDGAACLDADLDALRELFLAGLEDWAQLEIDRGCHWKVLELARGHAARHLLREKLASAWIRALAAAGRVSAALQHYEVVRRALAEELGISPSAPLSGLHARLLRADSLGPPEQPVALRSPGNQLPRDLPDFVGRVDALEEVTGGVLGRQQVVLVTGEVGAGKTSLAIHAGHQLAEMFADGRMFVELTDAGGAARPAGAVVADLLDMVGIDGNGSATWALARWRDWIAYHRVLLVLDDAVDPDVVRTMLPAQGASRVVVTSRHRLGALESVLRVPLPELPLADGVDLLTEIVGAGRVLTQRRAAERILSWCGGLPLAVRIVGSTLAAMRHVRLADYAMRLARAPCFLDELACGELAVLDRYRSFQLSLSDRQRRAFHCLAREESPIDHRTALASLSDVDDTPSAALDSLFECGILSACDGAAGHNGHAYRMSTIARSFGRAPGDCRDEAGAAP